MWRPEAEWRRERQAYLSELGPRVERRRERQSRGERHPVEDFLWEYYSLRGGRLLRWSPGAGVELENAPESEFPATDGYRVTAGGRVLDTEGWLRKRRSGLGWIVHLLQRTNEREGVYGCLGLHEWAMVYEQGDVRHDHVPLRVRHDGIRKMVESFPLQCTHYDAFRFFSEGARPFNRHRLTAEGRPDQEQPGCLHVNMDLFKWCMKLRPLVPSHLTLRAFRLADRAREIDMRASPYDLSRYGLEPIRIEEASGRREYVAHQRSIADEAAPLRRELIRVLEAAGEKVHPK